MSTLPAPLPEHIAREMNARYDALHAQFKLAARESAGTDKSVDAEPKRCRCKTPLPTELGDVWICGTCEEPLKVGDDDKPYRRFPGDLDTPDMLVGRKILEEAAAAKAEMLAMITQLPKQEQQRLMKLRGPKFHKTAKRMITAHARIKAVTQGDPTAGMGPNQRRRLRRMSAELADVVDETIRSHAELEALERANNVAGTDPVIDLIDAVLEHDNVPGIEPPAK